MKNNAYVIPNDRRRNIIRRFAASFLFVIMLSPFQIQYARNAVGNVTQLAGYEISDYRIVKSFGFCPQ
jgi:hypothetical protein